MSKELSPRHEDNRVLAAARSSVVLRDVDTLMRAVNLPDVTLNIIKINEQDGLLPSPCTNAIVSFSNYENIEGIDSEELYGNMSFQIPESFFISDDEENKSVVTSWQDTLIGHLFHTLSEAGLKVSTPQGYRNSLVVTDPTQTTYRFNLIEEAASFRLTTEVVNSHQSSDDRMSKFEKVTTFLQYWNQGLSAVIETLGETDGKNYEIKVDISQLNDIPPVKPEVGLVAPQQELLPYGERVTFDSIGGATQAKNILRTNAYAFKYPEAAAWYNIKPEHILLHGPPGTGKTSLARAFAGEINAEIFEIPSTSIVDKYVGESAKKLTKIIDTIKKANKPLVVFFDEIDSLAPKGVTGTTEREDVKNVLKKAIIDISADNPHIIIIGASNKNPDEFDEAIIRAGRLRPVFVSLPNLEERFDVWGIILHKDILSSNQIPNDVFVSSRGRLFIDDLPSLYSDDINLETLAKESDGLSGADMEQVLRNLRSRKFIEHIETNSFPQIAQSDILQAIRHYAKPGY